MERECESEVRVGERERESREREFSALHTVYEELGDQIQRAGTIQGACDNANVIEGTQRLLLEGQRSFVSEWLHRYRRIAQECQALPIALRWTRGHTTDTDIFSVLNRQADAECNRQITLRPSRR